MLDLNEFWNQLFSPLNNIVSIAIIVFITILSEKLVSEMEEEKMLEFTRFENHFLNKCISFILRFILAFVIVFLVFLAIIIVISLILALIGFAINFLHKS